MNLGVRIFLVWWALAGCVAGQERINQEGRILEPQTDVKAPTLFNTAAADAIVSSMQIMPVTSAWNEDISKRPRLINSDAMINTIISDLATNRRTLRVFFEMNFVLAPDTQPSVPISFFNYADESDPSPYPIPANMPVETWPRGTGALTLQQWQMDVNNTGGDRHAIIVQPGAGFIWETWLTKLTSAGEWTASNGARFDLKSNASRPRGWTSGDAAGLPMFPALVRFDECERGMVEHAMRIVVKRSRREYIYPATHFASTTAATETNVPAMGQRVRLKQSFAIPDAWTLHEKAVLLGLKKYGALVADNGGFFSISTTPDDRWPANAFSHLSSIRITNFEIIQTTGATEGPRSPGAPAADGGSDQVVPQGARVQLNGGATSASPATTQWRKYSGPGTVAFNDASKANANATFSVAGEYILMFSVDDGVHAVAYDAVHIRVLDALMLSVRGAGTGAELSWNGAAPLYVLEQAPLLAPLQWKPILTSSVHAAAISFTNGTAFFRIREP